MRERERRELNLQNWQWRVANLERPERNEREKWEIEELTTEWKIRTEKTYRNRSLNLLRVNGGIFSRHHLDLFFFVSLFLLLLLPPSLRSLSLLFPSLLLFIFYLNNSLQKYLTNVIFKLIVKLIFFSFLNHKLNKKYFAFTLVFLFTFFP